MALTRRIFLGAGASAMAAAQPTAPSDRINVGMIGVGSRSHELLEAIKDVEGTEVVAVCDAYSGRVERAIERTGRRAKRYPDYREILADASIDAVTIGTPDHWHKQMVLEALEAGKDVYCEKPLSYAIDEGLEIAAAAEKHAKIVQVGSQTVSSDAARELRRWIQSGRLGQVTMVRVAYNRNSPGGAWIYPIPPDASPETVDWEAFVGPAEKREFDLERFFRWRCYREYSGGIATDLFVHACTTIHFVTGAVMPSEVVASGGLYRWKESRDVPDTLGALLSYPQGFIVQLSSTFNSNAFGGYHFEVLGTEGSAQFAGRGLSFRPHPSYDNNGWIVGAWPTVLEQQYNRTPAGRAELRGRPQLKDEIYRDRGPDATVAHLADFFFAVRHRGSNVEDSWAGHHAASCAHLINASVDSGSAARWDFKRHREAA